MSTMSAPSATTSCTRSIAAAVFPGQSGPEERVRGAVDDRHDERCGRAGTRCRAAAADPARVAACPSQDPSTTDHHRNTVTGPRHQPGRRPLVRWYGPGGLAAARRPFGRTGAAVPARRPRAARARGPGPRTSRRRSATSSSSAAITARSWLAWCLCPRRPRSTWAIASSPCSWLVSSRTASSMPYPTGMDSDSISVTAGRPLAGQRLHDAGQLRPPQAEQRPGDQLGDPPAVGRDRAVAALVRAARRTP